MATAVGNLAEIDFGGRKSTTPASPFNLPRAKDSTLSYFQDPLVALQALDPEGVTRIYVSDAKDNLRERLRMLAEISEEGAQLEAGKTSFSKEFDCVLTTDSGELYILETKSLHSSRRKEWLAFPQTATSARPRSAKAQAPRSDDFAPIEMALNLVRAAAAQDKVRAQTKAAQAIAQTDAPIENADRAIRLLLSLRRSGCLDDAVDLLTLLGRNMVRGIVESHLSTYGPNGSNDDYWYALIRAAGRTGDGEIPRRFLGSQFIVLQEAAVQALGDIGDPAAVEELRKVTRDPTRPQLIRELADDLLSDLA